MTMNPARLSSLTASMLGEGGTKERTYAEVLDALYPKLSVGGYCLIDDYGALDACRRAVDDYRARHGISEEIHPVDWTGAYWRRERE